MKKDVLGIKIDDISLNQAVEIVIDWLKRSKSASLRSEKHYIVTPNPEIVVMAQSDEVFKKALNNADLSIPDGVGLKLGTDIVCNTPGVDLMEALIKASLDYGFTIGLLGGREGVAEEASDCLRKKYPKLRINFAEGGGKVDDNGKLLKPLKQLKLLNCDILFVAFGPPKQEKWIAGNLDKISVKVAMGVGGSFDYISGLVPRAPKLLRKLGLEWLFRLIIQPWRIGRQLRLIKFLYLLAKGS